MKDLNLVATKVGEYQRDGVLRHAYTVDGDAQSLAFYEAERGTYFSTHKESGKPLFTAKASAFIGSPVRLRYAPKTDVKFFIDTEEFNAKVQLANNYAKLSEGADINAIIAGIIGTPTPTPTVQAPSVEIEEEEEDGADLGDI